MKNNIRKLFYIFSQNKVLYRLAKRFVFDHRGENNCEIETNGEMFVLKEYLKETDVIFDVGANVGDWTKTVLDIVPEAQVHSFEPSVSTFETLKRNTFPSNVHINNVGLGIRSEEKEFYMYGENSTVNSLYLRENLSKKTGYTKEKITLKTLDGYCLDNNILKIDFLKIDVEGNELDVLKGAEKMLSENKVSIIQLEYGGTYIDAKIFLKDVFNYFENFSFSFYKILFNRIKLVTYDKDLENFQYCNYLIVNNNVKK